MSIRSTQFQGFAKLLFDELYDQFNNLYCQEDDGAYQGRDKEAEQTRKDIQETIACRAYDLISHACSEIDMEQDARERSLLYVPMMESVPDMTEWPNEERIKRLEGIFSARQQAFAPLHRLGVTFSDEQKEAIQRRQKEQ